MGVYKLLPSWSTEQIVVEIVGQATGGDCPRRKVRTPLHEQSGHETKNLRNLAKAAVLDVVIGDDGHGGGRLGESVLRLADARDLDVHEVFQTQIDDGLPEGWRDGVGVPVLVGGEHPVRRYRMHRQQQQFATAHTRAVRSRSWSQVRWSSH